MMEKRMAPSGGLSVRGKKPLSHRAARIDWLKWLVVLLPMLFVCATMMISLLNFIPRSFLHQGSFTTEYFVKVLTEPLYLQVLKNTLLTGVIVTIIALLLAYPMAYLSVTSPYRWVRTIITGGVLIPYWISMLVRIFAWQVILQTNGLVNQLLQYLHITSAPIQILYTEAAVVISLVHILLPYMFMSIQSNMEGIDRNLMTAAHGMGARPKRAFLDIFLPLSVPGIFSGSLMVFVLALGFYIAPALLGGADNMMMSNLVETNMNNFNWSLASALSVELLVIVFAIIAIAFKFVGNIFIPKK